MENISFRATSSNESGVVREPSKNNRKQYALKLEQAVEIGCLAE